MSDSPKPFTISIPDEKIERLHAKLAAADLPDELEDAGWDMGSPLADIKRLVNHWRDSFDWRSVEKKLNEELPQYKMEVEVEGFGNVGMHFVHKKSGVTNAVPLLFVHGWPGSFIEVSKILPELIQGPDDNKPAFHVVAPSIPNFGFSDGVKKRGFAFPQVAEACHKVMTALGYQQYVTQGGDLGYAITRWLSLKYPESCKANHLNMIVPAEPTLASNPTLFAKIQATPLSDFEKAGLARTQWFRTSGAAYSLMHNTRPQTVGYSLTDSPVGLLGWIYEKLVQWTDDYPWTDDEILTWISIYYFSTAGPAAPQRIYFEGDVRSTRENSSWERAGQHIQGSKLGVVRFPKEIVNTPKLWVQGMGDVVLDTEYERGGHFAATERPDALVAELRKMFGKGGPAYGVVGGKTGYES